MVRNPCSSFQSSFSHIRNFKTCPILSFISFFLRIMSNCHEAWMHNCTCKLQWGLRCYCARWHTRTFPVICPSRNSYTFGFLACLLLVLILMVHMIIIAWSFQLFSIFIAVRCQELEIYAATFITVAKKRRPYLLFILFSSFPSWRKARSRYCGPTALCISKEQGFNLITFFISLPNTKMPKRPWQQ